MQLYASSFEQATTITCYSSSMVSASLKLRYCHLHCAGLDVHRDTPVEILHTYLLGQDKYVWYATHSSWSDSEQQLFAARLQSSSVDNLSIYPLRGHYLMKYRNGLVGKHFKALQQVGVFHLHGDLYDEKLFGLWNATGRLGALLWYTTIQNMDDYLVGFEEWNPASDALINVPGRPSDLAR